MAIGIHHADHATTLYPQTLALTSPTNGGRSVGVVRSQTQATEFVYTQILHIISTFNFPKILLQAHSHFSIKDKTYNEQESLLVT
jgi:hypothetical protein